jgi:hypothetical protein
MLGVFAIVAVLGGSGCGVPRGMAVGATLPIVDGAVLAAYRNGDVDLIEAGMPSNLLLVEGLLENRPNDRRLLTLASQLYFSYAVGFIEDRNPERSQALYEKAMGFGLRAFPELDPAEHVGADGEETYREALLDMTKSDVEGLIWFAGSWGSWIKLNMGSADAMAQAPRLQQLAERLVELDGNARHGMPHLLLATIRALRPPVFGGDPEGALAAFDAGFAASDRKFLLMHLYFAKYYCRQVFDVDLFDRVLEELLAADPAALPDVLLLNKVAQAQGRRLKDMRDELF